MLGKNRQWIRIRAICLCWVLIISGLGLSSCSNRLQTSQLFDQKERVNKTAPASKLFEVDPPEVIQQLRRGLERYSPQVAILSPKNDEVLKDTNVNVRVDVTNLPVFKDEKLKLGPHINLILDDRLVSEIYNIYEPISLENLSKGTHTLRIFASTPWGESFKNEGAYAQINFSIQKKTDDKVPDLSKPLLTYNSPMGEYGAEPIALDFYLSNNISGDKAKIADYQIRVNLDNDSFIIDSWQPFYLKGFSQGKHSVELELVDSEGKSVNNVFNKVVKEFTYQPNGQDSLSKIVRGEISAEVATTIVDPNYQPPQPPPTVPSTIETTPAKSTSTDKEKESSEPTEKAAAETTKPKSTTKLEETESSPKIESEETERSKPVIEETKETSEETKETSEKTKEISEETDSAELEKSKEAEKTEKN